MSIFIKTKKYLTSILNQENLTRIASLNAFASILDYFARLLVAFFVTPLLVSGLGDYFFGMWQILNRFVGYISPASGRSTQALKFALANEQKSTEFDHKRELVGSAFITWLLFLPVIAVAGGILIWFIPIWLKTASEYIQYIRIAAAILVANVAIYSISILPQSVLQGENLGYKRMGLSPLIVIFGGFLTWLALYLDTGLIGVAAAALSSTIISGFVFLLITRRFAVWFGIKIPSFSDIKQFVGLSGWFIGWNLVMSFMMASDVIILGLLSSVESVTDYTLTKYVPETLISLIAIIVTGMIPGLGGIIGSGEFEKASSIRKELMWLTWLIATPIGLTIILWNRTFISLWVGIEHYAGIFPSLLIVIIVIQLVFIRNDASIIDLTLKLSHKVVLGGVSVLTALLLSAVLMSVFDLGIVGLCLGIILGRSILSIGYPIIITRFLSEKRTHTLKNISRPAIVSIIFFYLIVLFEGNIPLYDWNGITGWIYLGVMAGISVLILLVFSFFLGLSRKNQKIMVKRFSALFNRSRKA